VGVLTTVVHDRERHLELAERGAARLPICRYSRSITQ
jgi:hypothetical protein